LPRGDVLDALLEKLPVLIKLLGSLVEIPAVRGESGLVKRNNGTAGRAGEARDECTAGIARSNVL
jgi:hypothetical protein